MIGNCESVGSDIGHIVKSVSLQLSVSQL
jgi:hypothetical protein